VLSTEPRFRHVIVSGASGGIGSAIVGHLVAMECHVAALDIDFSSWTRPDSPDVSLHRVDLRDWTDVRAAVDAAVEALGGCDGVIANAAVVDTLHRAERFDRDDWTRDLDVNLSGAFALVMAAFEALRSSGDGRVVLVSSVAATLGQPAQVAYAAGKAGLIGVARTLAVEWAHLGIKCNVIMPGMIDTPKAVKLPADVRAISVERIPARRFGLPAEVAGTIGFLLSPAAAYITGAVIRVDGGFGLNGIALSRSSSPR
jgi:NAD(P)-dependent dehydrogenase (short-subunit alcohol dehydrogenase family)